MNLKLTQLEAIYQNISGQNIAKNSYQLKILKWKYSIHYICDTFRDTTTIIKNKGMYLKIQNMITEDG